MYSVHVYSTLIWLENVSCFILASWMASGLYLIDGSNAVHDSKNMFWGKNYETQDVYG